MTTPSGDVRLVPVLEARRRHAARRAARLRLGQRPSGRHRRQRLALLPAQRARAPGRGRRRAGLRGAGRVRARVHARRTTTAPGYQPEEEDWRLAHRGPVYSPSAMLDVDEFGRQLLGDLAANGLGIGQYHAEYGAGQLEIALDALDAVGCVRRAGAGPPDDPGRGPRARAAGELRPAAEHDQRRQRLAPALVAGARRRQRAHRRRPARTVRRRSRLPRRAAARAARRWSRSPLRRPARCCAAAPATGPAPSASGASRTARPRCGSCPPRR